MLDLYFRLRLHQYKFSPSLLISFLRIPKITPPLLEMNEAMRRSLSSTPSQKKGTLLFIRLSAKVKCVNAKKILTKLDGSLKS